MSTEVRVVVILVVAFAVAAGVVTLLREGSSDLAEPASAGQRRWTVEDAKQFDEFPLYWLGESCEGLPLTNIIRSYYDPEPPIPAVEAENAVVFIYGSCTPDASGGCAPPLSIRVEPYCMRPPQQIASGVKVGEPISVRNAVGQYISGDHLRVWTQNVSIAVFTRDSGSQLGAAENLRLVTEGQEGTSKPLGPPSVAC